jgi:hypothetical protein
MQDAFEDWMDLRARECRGEWFDGKASGLTFANPDGSSRQMIAATLAPFEELQLVPEPANPFDSNAIALFTAAGEQVGYLEKRLAGELSRHMAKGTQARCFVRAVRNRGDTMGVSFGLLQWSATT